LAFRTLTTENSRNTKVNKIYDQEGRKQGRRMKTVSHSTQIHYPLTKSDGLLLLPLLSITTSHLAVNTTDTSKQDKKSNSEAITFLT
jgi:hypothetical protein